MKDATINAMIALSESLPLFDQALEDFKANFPVLFLSLANQAESVSEAIEVNDVVKVLSIMFYTAHITIELLERSNPPEIFSEFGK